MADLTLRLDPDMRRRREDEALRATLSARQAPPSPEYANRPVEPSALPTAGRPSPARVAADASRAGWTVAAYASRGPWVTARTWRMVDALSVRVARGSLRGYGMWHDGRPVTGGSAMVWRSHGFPRHMPLTAFHRLLSCTDDEIRATLTEHGAQAPQ